MCSWVLRCPECDGNVCRISERYFGSEMLSEGDPMLHDGLECDACNHRWHMFTGAAIPA